MSTMRHARVAAARQVVKKTGVALRNRIIAAPAVEAWHRRVEGLEREVAEVMREEREERALRRAEQEATKVIYSPGTLRFRQHTIHSLATRQVSASRVVVCPPFQSRQVARSASQ